MHCFKSDLQACKSHIQSMPPGAFALLAQKEMRETVRFPRKGRGFLPKSAWLWGEPRCLQAAGRPPASAWAPGGKGGRGPGSRQRTSPEQSQLLASEPAEPAGFLWLGSLAQD